MPHETCSLKLRQLLNSSFFQAVQNEDHAVLADKSERVAFLGLDKTAQQSVDARLTVLGVEFRQSKELLHLNAP